MKINPYVFFPAALLILLFVVAGALFDEPTGVAFGRIQDLIVDNFGWFYIVSVAGFLVFVLALLLLLSARSPADHPLHPLPPAREEGARPVGHLVDVLAVFGTLFGLATSLGLGVTQIDAGLEHLGLLGASIENQLFLIAGITLAATVSVATGVQGGVRRLSELNMGLATSLLLFVFTIGPTVFILSSFVQAIGNYRSSIVQMTFRTDAFIGLDWQKSWTMLYWGWWISWSPFVGMFIARVSKGRTLREFVLGVLFVPTLLTFFWTVVFGGRASTWTGWRMGRWWLPSPRASRPPSS